MRMARSSCPKCGINRKSGKRSCCVRGGAWFRKCGDPGDTKFAHTWLEGINVCDNLGALFSNKARSIQRNQIAQTDLGVAHAHAHDGSQQKSADSPAADASHVGTANFEDCAVLSKIALLVSVLIAMLYSWV